ncbi:MAG: DUF4115 domain-containing protein [Thermodesulfobacteriota bacterium]|nr:DUF4115 domain-containing protein [Thermodesulfobacteriota bacterium]
MSTKPDNTDLKLSPRHDFPDTETASTIGKFLQRERKERHLSLDEIAEATCIHIHVLKAIENDNAKKLPAKVFTRGFIKLYLRQLDIDPQEILDHYMPKKSEGLGSTQENYDREEKTFSAASLAESTPFLTPKRALFLLITFLIGILIFWVCQTFRSADKKSSDLQYEQVFEKYPAHEIPTTHETDIAAMHDESEDDSVAVSPSFEDQTAKSVEPAEETEKQVTRDKKIPVHTTKPPTFDIQIAVQETKPPAAEPEETDNNEVQPVPVQSESHAEHSSESAPAPPLETPPPSQLAGTNTPADVSPALSDVDKEKKDRRQKTKYTYILKAMFTEKTWIQIVLDDKPLRDAIYKAGSRRIWRAREKINLHIGNAGGVNLTLNGSPVPSLGASGRSRKISIPDDLPL